MRSIIPVHWSDNTGPFIYVHSSDVYAETYTTQDHLDISGRSLSKWPIDSKVLKGMKEMKSKVLISFLMASLVFLILFQVEGFAAD